MTKRYTHAIFIGRFEPWHNGHQSAALKALEIADNVLFLVGSAYQAKTPMNPLSFHERQGLIMGSMRGRPHFIFSIEDQPEEDWVADVQQIVADFQKDDSKVCIVGHLKDESSYYLKIFPQWKFIDVGETPVVHNGVKIGATLIRDLMFTGHWDLRASMIAALSVESTIAAESGAARDLIA